MISKDKLNQILRIHESITSNSLFLQSRLNAEDKARQMLQQKSGSFNADDLTLFLNYCNTELVPKDQFSHEFKDHETVTRFQLSFIGKNRNLILQSLEACNFWIKKLWDSDEDSYVVLSHFWKNNEVAGAGIGFPTMILYLKNSEKYNVWLPFLNDSLSSIIDRELSNKESIENYIIYNYFINHELKDRVELKPQEIDYILYRIKAMRQS